MIRFIIILAVLILALSFFGISIRHIVESPVGHDNFTFIWELVKAGGRILMAWIHTLIATIEALLPQQGS
jgi:hypothetical protein